MLLVIALAATAHAEEGAPTLAFESMMVDILDLLAREKELKTRLEALNTRRAELKPGDPAARALDAEARTIQAEIDDAAQKRDWMMNEGGYAEHVRKFREKAASNPRPTPRQQPPDFDAVREQALKAQQQIRRRSDVILSTIIVLAIAMILGVFVITFCSVKTVRNIYRKPDGAPKVD